MAKIHDLFIVELAEVIKGYGNEPDDKDPFRLSEFYRFYELPNIAISRENFEKMRPIEPERKTGKWIPCSERLPEYGVAVLTYDGMCYCVEKRIPTIRDDNGEPISGEWWVSDDYDENNSEYYPNLRDGACIAWMPLPEPYKEGER